MMHPTKCNMIQHDLNHQITDWNDSSEGTKCKRYGTVSGNHVDILGGSGSISEMMNRQWGRRQSKLLVNQWPHNLLIYQFGMLVMIGLQITHENKWTNPNGKIICTSRDVQLFLGKQTMSVTCREWLTAGYVRKKIRNNQECEIERPKIRHPKVLMLDHDLPHSNCNFWSFSPSSNRWSVAYAIGHRGERLKGFPSAPRQSHEPRWKAKRWAKFAAVYSLMEGLPRILGLNWLDFLKT